MIVVSPPRRTFRTSLTDDELLLFDALFDVWDTPESLLPENYRAWHNLPSGHGLDAAALTGTIQALIERDLMRSRTEQGPRGEMTWLGLSDRGGGLWEFEREPPWSLYCTDGCWPSEAGDGAWMLSVRSPALQTARAFLTVAERCKLYDVDPDLVTIGLSPGQELIPWREFAAVYEVRVPIAEPTSGSVDWIEYEKHRIWWRNIAELSGLAV